MKNIHTQESGRSMVEMLGVLAIIGVLSVGGIAGYSQAMSKFKVSKTIDQVQTLITNIRTLYAGSRTFTGLTAARAKNMGLLTEETYDGTNGLNPFGGMILFGTASGGRTFQITYTKLTGEACVRLATADWGADRSSGLVSIAIATAGTTAVDATLHNWDSTGAASLPVDVGSAVDQCGDKDTGVITWTFK